MRKEIEEELRFQHQRERQSSEEHGLMEDQFKRSKEAIDLSMDATRQSLAASKKNTFKKVAGGVGSAARGTGRVIGATGRFAGNVGRSFGSSAMNLINAGSSTSSEWMFFFIVLVLHVIDLLTGLNRVGSLAVWWILFYAVIALVVAPIMIHKGGLANAYLSKRVIVFVLVSIVAWILPIFISKLPDIIIYNNNWFPFLVIMTPPWVLFLFFGHTNDKRIIKLRNWWIVIWIFLFIVTALTTITHWNIPVELQGQYKFNVWEVLKNTWFNIWGNVKDIFAKLIGIPASFGIFVSRNLNDSIGQNFMGKVDPYTSGDLGVRFTEIRTFTNTFYEGQEITIWADIQGESFREELHLNLRCFAVSPDGEQFNGTIRSQSLHNEYIRIMMREKVSASCTFDKLPKGNYFVWFAGAFSFETWGYIQYYFAPDELIKDMWTQDINPAREAGIKERPIGIFTNGPVKLGLASEYNQPIPINHIVNLTNGDNPDRTLPPYGASLANLWNDGYISSVRHITLMVPEPFILKNCDRKPVQGNKSHPQFITRDGMPGYREYTFGNIDSDGANLGFESAVCFLGFDNPASAERLMSSFDLVVKTFAAKTNYLYIIEDRVQVRVQ